MRDLTFADNLFPPVPTLGNPLAPPGLEYSFNLTGLTLRFPERGDYVIRIQDLRGKSRAYSIANARDAFLPGTSSWGGQILSIWRGNRKIHQSLIGAP